MADSLIHCQTVAGSLNSRPSVMTKSSSSVGVSYVWAFAPYLRTGLFNVSPLIMINDLVRSRGGGSLQAQGEGQGKPVVVANDEKLGWWEKDLGATIRDLHSAQELSEAISAADGKLVIVEFFATWCGSCRALYPKLCKLAAEHSDIVFVKVNFDENKALCKRLKVKVLPYFHFYRGASTQLESFSCSVTKLQRLKDAISKHKAGGQYASLQDDAATPHE